MKRRFNCYDSKQKIARRFFFSPVKVIWCLSQREFGSAFAEWEIVYFTSGVAPILIFTAVALIVNWQNDLRLCTALLECENRFMRGDVDKIALQFSWV